MSFSELKFRKIMKPENHADFADEFIIFYYNGSKWKIDKYDCPQGSVKLYKVESVGLFLQGTFNSVKKVLNYIDSLKENTKTEQPIKETPKDSVKIDKEFLKPKKANQTIPKTPKKKSKKERKLERREMERDKKALAAIPSEEEILSLAKSHRIECRFCAGIIYFSTPFGKWYIESPEFTIDKGAYELYHKNTRGDEYHLQNKKFFSIKSIIEYIETHDYNKLRRENIQRNEEMRVFNKVARELSSSKRYK